MRIGNFEFKPGWKITILTVIALPVLIRLGIWQLHRAEEKRQIIQSQQEKMDAPVYRLVSHIDNPAELEYRRIQVTGTFDTRHILFLDNKIHLGKPGYDVVIPFRIAGTDDYVLVNRGWVVMNPDRRILPSVSTPESSVTINGVAKLNPKDVADFGSGNRANTGWPAVVRWPDIGAIEKETGISLEPFILLESAQESSGFVREWVFVNAPPEKSQSYAVQWFTFALIVLILYIVLNSKRVNSTGNNDG